MELARDSGQVTGKAEVILVNSDCSKKPVFCAVASICWGCSTHRPTQESEIELAACRAEEIWLGDSGLLS